MIIKLRMMRQGENSALKRRDAYKMSIGVVENSTLVELGVDKRIILKCIFMFLHRDL